MIPTIEQIIEDLLAGTITKQQAIGWLHQHAEDAGRWLRDDFAAAAMQGFMSGPSMEVADGVATAERINVQTLIVRSAYQIADAMLVERSRTSHAPSGDK